MATTFDDNTSVASSHVQPQAPHPTPVHTIAGDIPTNEFIVNKLFGLDIGASAVEHSDPGKHDFYQSSVTENYPEASKWDGVAEEDLVQALQRLAVVAEDDHKEDPSKSVEHYYSVRLAEIIGGGTIKFDAAYLK